jgi:hypothetical protein
MRNVHDPLSDAGAQCTGGTYQGRTDAVLAKYKTFGLISFYNAVAGLSDAELRERFSGSVIVVDEAHQLRNSTDASAHQALQRVLSVSADIKLLLLTATPMFNSTSDIVPLLNLLRLNDRRDTFQASSVLGAKTTNFEELEKAAAGYVSYARGYSPVSFPAMLRPSDAGPASLKAGALSGGLRGGGAKRRVDRIVDESGAPVPIPDRIETLIAELQSPSSRTRLQSTLAPVLEIVGSEMQAGGAQIIAYEKEVKNIHNTVGDEDEDGGYDDDADDEDSGVSRTGHARQVCNVAFPSGLVGRKGFRSAFEMDAGTRTWRYRKGVSQFLAPGAKACKAHACKIDTIAECVASERARNSFKLIYSRWIWSGVLPMAVALEHRGFRMYEGGIASKENSIPRYAIISGMREHGDPNRVLKVARSMENIRGGLINILLMTDKGSEGLDFRFVRELHVMEPWFHMKKIEQIVGRASRHCSHSALPLEERNVTVYLHAAVRPLIARKTSKIESVDIRTFRLALGKENAILRAEAALVRASIPGPGSRAHASYDVQMVSAQGRLVRVRGPESGSEPGGHRVYDDSTFDPAKHVDLSKLRRLILERLRMHDAPIRGCTVEDLVTHCFPGKVGRWAVASIVAAIHVENPGDGALIRRGGNRIFELMANGRDDDGDAEDAIVLTKTLSKTSGAKASRPDSTRSNMDSRRPSPDEIMQRCEGVKQLVKPYVELASSMPTEIVDFVVDRLGVDEVIGAAVTAYTAAPASASASAVADSMQRSGVLSRTPRGAFLQSPFPKGGCFVVTKGGTNIRPCVSGERPETMDGAATDRHHNRALDDPWVRGGFMDRPPRPKSATRDKGGSFVFKLATSDNKRGSVCEQTSALKNSAVVAAIERLCARSRTGMRLRPETKMSMPKNVACILMELALRREAPSSFIRPAPKTAM